MIIERGGKCRFSQVSFWEYTYIPTFHFPPPPQVAESEHTEEEIDRTRGGYQVVSDRAATLFFLATDFAAVDPMYQYSLVGGVTCALCMYVI